MSSSTEAGVVEHRPWSQFVMEVLPDFMHVLTPDGRILYASPSCKAVTGFERTELEGRFVSSFIHPDDYESFVDALNESVSLCSPVRSIYRFRKPNSEWTVLESNGHAHVNSVPGTAWFAEHYTVNQGFFMVARPYFNNTTTLLDSFLEHKIEHERLLAWKAELEHELDMDQAAEALEFNDTESHISFSHFNAPTGLENAYFGDANLFLAPQGPYTASNTIPTQLHLLQGPGNESHGPLSGESSMCIVDAKQPNHKNTEHKHPREVTRYFRGDAGIRILVHEGNKTHSAKMAIKKDKKKKDSHNLSSYICMHCSTMASPEWRKGPEGPRTLCNACGRKSITSKGRPLQLIITVRWSKERRKSCQDTEE
jgi:PAS domain S-box-containing protein